MLSPPASLEEVPSAADILATMEGTVAGLDDFKKRLALILRRHLVAGVLRRDVHPPNLLVIGPTGGGKTHTLHTVLKALPAPWLQSASTAYTDTGYTGTHLPSLYAQLLADPQWREGRSRGDLVPIVENFGVVILDEFDKLRLVPGADERSMARNRALQAELLTITEGTVMQARHDEGGDKGATVRTHGILHIAVGAFEGLNQLVAAAHEHQTVAPNAYESTEIEDLVKFGFLEELVGRFSAFLTVPPLNADHLVRILRQHILPNYERELADDGLTLVVDDAAAYRLAERAALDPVGARSLAPDLEDHLWRAWYTAPAGATVHLRVEHIDRDIADLEDHVELEGAIV